AHRPSASASTGLGVLECQHAGTWRLITRLTFTYSLRVTSEAPIASLLAGDPSTLHCVAVIRHRSKEPAAKHRRFTGTCLAGAARELIHLRLQRRCPVRRGDAENLREPTEIEA